MWVRLPLVPGLTDAEPALEGAAAFVAGLGSVERVELRPRSRDGALPTAGQLAAARRPFAGRDLTVD
jgi:pyruvate-formate lyase-activating enzyme